VSRPSSEKKCVEVAIAVVFDRAHQHVLVCKRKDDAVLAGFWEFPGGKCDPGEAPRACAIREVREEVGIDVAAVGQLDPIEHEYPYAHVRLHPFVCEFIAGAVQRLEVADARWVPSADVASYEFPPANETLVRRVAAGWDALVR